MSPRYFRNAFLFVCAVFFAASGTRPSPYRQSEGAPRAASAETHSGTLLVFPFENDSRIASLDWLGEGLSELTTERLQVRGVSLLSRQERLATLEKIGLPDSARFSHATMVKIATEADADEAVFGRFVSDGKSVTLEARLLRLNPPWLSPTLTESGPLDNLLRVHARLSWRILCALAQRNCLPPGANTDESSFVSPPPSMRADALQNFVRGIVASDEESRLRSLREASRVEPDWDRPAFELGQVYFAHRNCEAALPWLSRVPLNRPDGPEATFDTGVCYLVRNDSVRAEGVFSSLMERIRSADPNVRIPQMPDIRNNIGVARLRAGKLSDAASEFEWATAIDEEEPDYWVNLGIAKLAGKQFAAAIPPFERARKLDPEDKSTRALLISALESLGRTSEAAALRAESAASFAGAASPVPQDPAALARMVRISMKFDRALLRPSGDAPAAQPSHGADPQKREGDGARR